MSKYEYKDYKTLLDDITSGVYVVQQPIFVDNHPISFLGNLLNYSNIDKTNLHKILISILNKIKTELFKQQLKKTGSTMVEYIHNQWIADEDDKSFKDKLFCEHDCECLGNVKDHMDRKAEYEEFINELEEKFSEQKVFSKMLPEEELNEYSVLELRNSIEDINKKCKMITDELEEKFSDQKVYSKLLPEQDLNEYSVLELRNSVEDINSKCKTITDALDSDLHLINSEKHKIDKIDLSLLLDLSMKHINLYQQLNTDTNQTEVSPNIHNLYMNYTLVINLLKKQINHIRNILLHLKNEVESKCKNTNELLHDIKSSRVQYSE
mgnify:CR=1 FL=1